MSNSQTVYRKTTFERVTTVIVVLIGLVICFSIMPILISLAPILIPVVVLVTAGNILRRTFSR
jgi:hypothetical protein